jgi:hypothetical protein
MHALPCVVSGSGAGSQRSLGYRTCCRRSALTGISTRPKREQCHPGLHGLGAVTDPRPAWRWHMSMGRSECAACIAAVLVGLAHVHVCACRCRQVESEYKELYGDRCRDVRGAGIEPRNFKSRLSDAPTAGRPRWQAVVPPDCRCRVGRMSSRIEVVVGAYYRRGQNEWKTHILTVMFSA